MPLTAQNSMEAYQERFIRSLNQDYGADPVCRRIAADPEFAAYCGTMLRRYADPAFTDYLAADRIARLEALHAAKLRAIDGLEASADCYRLEASMYHSVDPTRAAASSQKAVQCHTMAAEHQAALPGIDRLLDTRSHGRFEDQGIIITAKQEMEKTLGPVTYETLANLVNASATAHGREDDACLDAEALRKRIDNFLARNPHWPQPETQPT